MFSYRWYYLAIQYRKHSISYRLIPISIFASKTTVVSCKHSREVRTVDVYLEKKTEATRDILAHLRVVFIPSSEALLPSLNQSVLSNRAT